MTVLSSQAERTLSFTVFIGSLPVFGDFFCKFASIDLFSCQICEFKKRNYSNPIRPLRRFKDFVRARSIFSRSDQFHVLLNFVFGDR